MRVNFNKFSAGEISPRMAGMGNLPGAANGCFRLRNFFPSVTSGASRRPRLEYCGNAISHDVTPYLVPFNFSAGDALLLEFGDNEFQVWDDGVSGVSVSTDWDSSVLTQLRYRQINDIVYFCDGATWPYRLTRNSNTDWDLDSFEAIFDAQSTDDGFSWPPMLDENPNDVTLTASATTGNITLTASADTFTAGQSYYQISHRRDMASDELFIPVLPAASADMSIPIVPFDGVKFVINGTEYTWKTDAAGPYQIDIESTIADCRDNVISAVNADPTDNNVYGGGTAPHPDVEASEATVNGTSAFASAVLTSDGSNLYTDDPTLEFRRVYIGSSVYMFRDNVKDTLRLDATVNVKRGTTGKATLENLVKAINATGKNSVNYYAPSGVTAHPDVTAAMTADNQVKVTAKTAGTAGNAVTISTTEPILSWSGTTLTGGTSGATERVRIEAREVGEDGNDITVGGMSLNILSGTHPADGDTVTVNGVTYTFKTTITLAANDVHRDGTVASALLNLARAINGTGTPGTDYSAATTANTTVSASEDIVSGTLKLASRSTSPSSIAVSDASANLSWTYSTFQLPFSQTTLSGGASASASSDGIEILGDYKIWSYGLAKGTVLLERLRTGTADTWEAVRQWSMNNDRNIAEEGEALYPQTLRLRVIGGVGTSSADVDRPRFVVEATDARISGLVKITSLTSATEAQATVIKALHSTDATAQWAECAWSERRGFPRGLTIHNQRLVFFGSDFQPQTIWSSATGDFHNFRRGVNDADGFTSSIAGDESSPIEWGISLGSGMVLGKQTEEWLCTSSDGQSSISPTNFQAKKQSAYGSSGVDPIIVGPRLIFVQSGGRTLLDYQFAWDEQVFAALELNEISNHLTRGRVKQLAYSRKPEQVVWVVTEDGKLLTMHYRREKEQIAWAYHPTPNPSGAEATVESVSVVNGTSSVDHIYFAVKRTINGDTRRYIERIHMQTVLDVEEDDIDEVSRRKLVTYLDCSKTAAGAYSAGDSVSGFSHLENETVSVYVDGAWHADKRVNGGAVVLDRAATESVMVGIDYSDNSQLIPFNIDIGSINGTTVGKNVHLSEITVRLHQSSGIRHKNHFSNSDTELLIGKIYDSSTLGSGPPPVVNDVFMLCQSPRYTNDLRAEIRPLNGEPLNVLSLVLDFKTL